MPPRTDDSLLLQMITAVNDSLNEFKAEVRERLGRMDERISELPRQMDAAIDKHTLRCSKANKPSSNQISWAAAATIITGLISALVYILQK